jgi:BMFP domain-containing protein YqiC
MKRVLRDVLGTFVELPSEPAAEADRPTTSPPPAGAVSPPPPPPEPVAAGAGTPATPGTTAAGVAAAAASTTSHPPEAGPEPAPDPALEQQIDQALAQIAPAGLAEFLALYEQMAFIPNPADRARAVLVAKGLSAEAVHQLLAGQLAAIGKVQSSFATTLGTRLAQADALARTQIDDAEANIAQAREQIAALEAQIAELAATKQQASEARAAAHADHANRQRGLELACERRRVGLQQVRELLAALTGS